MEQELALYCIADKATGLYLSPFTSHNNNTAIRQFENAVAQEGHEFNLHPEDFALFRIGTFHLDSAKVETCENTPNIIMTATDIMKHRDGTYEQPTPIKS